MVHPKTKPLFNFRMYIREPANSKPKSDVIIHFLLKRKYQTPLVVSGLPQLAKTKIKTSTKKWKAVCHSGRVSSGSGIVSCDSALADSSLR